MAIAIVSAGLRFPQAKTLSEFWQPIYAARDLQSAASPGRWPLSAAELQSNAVDAILHDRVYEVAAYKESAEGLNLEQALLDGLDPLFHLTCGAGRDAFFKAQTTTLDRRRCGVILGNIALPTAASAERAYHWLRQQWKIGSGRLSASALQDANNSAAALPARVLARALNFSGEVFTLDAACASSLYALKYACDALESQRQDFVLAGGVSRPYSLYSQIGFSALQALSRGGRCYALDSRADGLLVGEGAGIFGLKRLADAIAAGDQILAVIRGVGLSNDREGRLMAPSSEGQLRAMRAAYKQANWEVDSVDLIECHATGTPLGDSTEFASLRALWQNAAPSSKAVLGSVKPNVGHMLTAAGAAGVSKILMAMQEKILAPTANFVEAHPDWNLENSPFRILSQAEAWPAREGRPRRAAVSGFGFGGINAHLLLEEYQPSAPSQVMASLQPQQAVVIVAAACLDAESLVGPSAAAASPLPQLAVVNVATASFDAESLVGLSEPAASPLPQQAVVNVAAASLDAESLVFPSAATASPLPQQGDRPIEQFQIGYQQFRIPPLELREALPLQVLGLLSGEQISLPQIPAAVRQEMGCLVGLELDPLSNLYACRWALAGDRPISHRDASLQAELDAVMPPLNANRVIGSLGSIVASRIAREWRLGGPSFTVSAQEQSGLQALGVAYRGIASGEIPAALVLALDLPTSHRARAQWQETFGEQGPTLADRGIALCLMRASLATELNLPVLLKLDAFEAKLEDATVDLKIKSEGFCSAADGLASLFDFWRQSPQQAAMQHFSYKARDGSVTLLQFSQLNFQERPAVGHQAASFYQLPRSDLQLSPRPVQAKSVKLPDPPVLGSARPRSRVEAPVSAAPPQRSWDIASLIAGEQQQLRSHEQFLHYRREGDALVEALLRNYLSASTVSAQEGADSKPSPHRWVGEPFNKAPALYDYAACQEFARGSIAQVFGPDYAAVDAYPSRVRLPDERLLLCHRVIAISGEAKSLGAGTIITEHDVFPDAWYLEDGHMPTSIAVESGQADLMLAAYLGADFHTQGRAVYRLLDARVSFHRAAPRAGETIRYTIQIKRFFEQSGLLFFHFAFEASIAGEAFMSMTDGCAGFFPAAALEAGRGIKRSQLQSAAACRTGGFEPLVPQQRCSFDDAALDALRLGRYTEAFGPAFASLTIEQPKGLPGGDMRLVHRILDLDPEGGRFACGRIIGEADIHADDWFLSCHFIDDQVMPGTLMYECCLHTLRVFLMRLGWVGEAADLHFEALKTRWSQLKCRGQVLASTLKVRYDIEIKEIGYQPEPYVICDALMSADGRDIVDITDMSLHLPGLDQAYFERLWQVPVREETPARPAAEPVAYTYEQILAFSSGRPSDCFGPIYAIFDAERRIARLPRPPFQFLDRIEWINGPFMQQHVGTQLCASYDPPADAWYWQAEGSELLPLAVLVEIALQPCGFMAAYMGSALLSEADLAFRNLAGDARLLQSIKRCTDRLWIDVTCKKISRNGDMIIQDYSFLVRNRSGPVYEGTTSFGFFNREALAQQVGLRQFSRWQAPVPAGAEAYPRARALPQAPLLMVEQLERAWAPAGRYEMGILYGQKVLRPEEWFFEAHFFQDPVMPGSLGLQALEQVLKAEAHRIWPSVSAWGLSLHAPHRWTYRGQVIPTASALQYELHIKEIDHELQQIKADAWLYCDKLPIYSLLDLALQAETTPR